MNKMNLKTFLILAFVLGLLLVGGCSSAEKRYDQYNNVYGGQGAPPPQAGAGCGVVMPDDIHEVNSAAAVAL